jgi:hypothetical protein
VLRFITDNKEIISSPFKPHVYLLFGGKVIIKLELGAHLKEKISAFKPTDFDWVLRALFA